MAPKKRKLVERPEDAPQFRKLVLERQQLLERRERDAREWAWGRGRLDDLGGQQSVTDRASAAWQEIRDEQQRLHKRLGEIETADRAAKKRLREIDAELPLVRQKAAATIAAEVAAEINGPVREYLKARFEQDKAALVAAATVFPLRDAAETRRVGLRGTVIPRDLALRQQELSRLREDAEAALAVGVLKKADVPRGVAAAWGL